jgi:hypothetical protein
LIAGTFLCWRPLWLAARLVVYYSHYPWYNACGCYGRWK